MARLRQTPPTTQDAPKRTREEWEHLGAEAILDLLADKFAAPWAEVEARISVTGWKTFDRVQPVQLSGARRQLRQDGLILEDSSAHAVSPVRMIRLPYEPGRQRQQGRLLGARVASSIESSFPGRPTDACVASTLNALSSTP